MEDSANWAREATATSHPFTSLDREQKEVLSRKRGGARDTAANGHKKKTKKTNRRYIRSNKEKKEASSQERKEPSDQLIVRTSDTISQKSKRTTGQEYKNTHFRIS